MCSYPGFKLLQNGVYIVDYFSYLGPELIFHHGSFVKQTDACAHTRYTQNA